MSGIICIGHVGGNGWRAELDFDASEAIIVRSGKSGTIGPIATVPLGVIIDGDDDHDPTLDPECEQNRNLMSIVFSQDAWKCLHALRDDAKRMAASAGAPDSTVMFAENVMEEIDAVLELLEVPTE